MNVESITQDTFVRKSKYLRLHGSLPVRLLQQPSQVLPIASTLSPRLPLLPSTRSAVPCARISGPLPDRIDCKRSDHIELPGLTANLVDYKKLSDKREGEPSECVRARVEAARQRQRAHFLGTNLTATPTWVEPMSEILRPG
jgi:hypothetical protein